MLQLGRPWTNFRIQKRQSVAAFVKRRPVICTGRLLDRLLETRALRDKTFGNRSSYLAMKKQALKLFKATDR